VDSVGVVAAVFVVVVGTVVVFAEGYFTGTLYTKTGEFVTRFLDVDF